MLNYKQQRLLYESQSGMGPITKLRLKVRLKNVKFV